MRSRLSIYYTYGIIALWAIACFVFFQGLYSYHFFYKEQTQLFLFSVDYLNTYFSKPAWLACLGGDFLTQFFYYKFAGAAILTCSVAFSVFSAFSLSDYSLNHPPLVPLYNLPHMHSLFNAYPLKS